MRRETRIKPVNRSWSWYYQGTFPGDCLSEVMLCGSSAMSLRAASRKWMKWKAGA